ncbi:histidine kinase [Streptosporangium sp. NPDC049248]|uniref:sensor histidine kinase n=1 Tax=Streptosporangium sp. NPDC049248 TaxID=3155651 RepID=UPI00343BED73
MWVWWGATLIAVVGVALRRRPVPMLALCAVSAGVHLALVVPLVVVDLATPILLYTVASDTHRKVSLFMLTGLLVIVTCWSTFGALSAQPAGGLPGALKTITTVEADPGAAPTDPVTLNIERKSGAGPASGLLVIASVLVAAWAIGSSSRNRRSYLQQLRARAADLDRERDQRAEMAVAAERSRITRELHDVVAHGLSVMVVQAQGGEAALDNRPDDTRSALQAVITTGRASLADMRRVLTTTGQLGASLHPEPGLAQLPRLIDRVNEAATSVTLRIEGGPTSLPPAVDLSAYRIVQEALTNTMKHAGRQARARVLVSYRESSVQLEISDDGRDGTGNDGAGNDGAGQGLRGMRERVETLGGDLFAGPGSRGGFIVRARLPFDGAAR